MVEIQMNTFTAQELVEFYQKVEDGSIIEYRPYNLALWQTQEKPNGPNLECRKDNWRISPTKKVIDLSVLIGSEVLCVFFDPSTPSSTTGKLKEVRGSAYVSNNINSSGRPEYARACKPLLNHKHAWQGNKCPLPEGFMVKVWYRGGGESVRPIASGNGLYWAWNYKPSDIIAFEVLGLADGYVMPWEQDK